MISVIVCTYNRAALLQGVLEDLSNQKADKISWELVVVDNNSTDQTPRVVAECQRRAPQPVTYVFEPQQGKSFALNTGMSTARGEIFAFTDDDVRVDPGWIRAISTAFSSGDCDLAGGRIRPLWSATPPDWYVRSGPYALAPTTGELDLGDQAIAMHRSPFGANMAVRRRMVDQYGPFRTDLGPRGREQGRMEDTEFGNRLIKAGARCLFLPNAIVHHVVQPEHATKRHVLNLYFSQGRSSMQSIGVPEFPKIFGVPRYLFRQLVSNCVRWLFALNGKRRFYFKLQTYFLWGQIVQSYRISRSARLA